VEPEASEIPLERLRTLRRREIERFVELRPRGTRLLERAKTSMPNGVPTAWMASLYHHPPVVVKRGSGGAFTDVDDSAGPACGIQTGEADVDRYLEVLDGFLRDARSPH
jgi:hypothetical protein